MREGIPEVQANPEPENRNVEITPQENLDAEVKMRKVVEFLDKHNADDEERQMMLDYLKRNPDAVAHFLPGKLVLKGRSGRSSSSFEA